MSVGLQVLGMALGVLGWLGTIVACALPMWKVSAFIGSNIITAQTYWEGLWMTCVVQSTGQMQCKVYDSMLALPRELQASRALLILSLLVAVIATFAAMVGGKCTNCLAEGSSSKARVALAAGVFFLVAGVLGLIPPCWTAHRVITDFYSPLVHQSVKRELGAALFICWASAALMLVGGGLLCSSCPRKLDGNVGPYRRAPPNPPKDTYI